MNRAVTVAAEHGALLAALADSIDCIEALAGSDPVARRQSTN